MISNRKAIVIGSGIAGLAIATRLAVQGYQVDVYETNSHPGGKLDLIELNGFRFDAGPSLFTQPENVEDLFLEAGEPIEKYFNYSEVDIVCNYFFESGKRLKTYADREKLKAEFANVLNEDPETIENYLNKADDLYRNIGHLFLHKPLQRKETWFNRSILSAIKALRWPYLFSSLHKYNQSEFKNKETVQLFNRFATYNGSNPYKAPAMLSVIPHLEQNQGTYYPKGGMISITNALYQLALKKGVKFHFNQKVTKINYKNDSISGIEVNGKSIDANLVVSNGDVYHTFQKLLGIQKRAATLEKMERSSSAIIFYWGIQKDHSELGLHNILFSANYEAEFDCLFNSKSMYEDPTIYINITSKMEKGMCPEGTENWFVMINAPADYGQDWETLVSDTRKRVIDKINRNLNTNIEEHLVAEKVMDPTGIKAKTETYRGSLYGTSSNSKFAAFFRPSNEFRSIKGLYFCGGTVHPGGGIPLCMNSAKITAELIRKNNGND
jgi:phytoene desaturase